MNQYQAAANSMRDDLIRALRAAKTEFEAIPVTPRGHRSIAGMSLELFVQEGYVQVSLRTDDDKWKSRTIGDWQFAGFLSSVEGPCEREMRRIAKTMKSLYSQIPKNDAYGRADRCHMIYLAAAEAIMDEHVVGVLNSYMIEAPVFGDALGSDPFTFFVYDNDRNLDGNYCDIVRGHRVTARILRGEA